MALLLLKTGLGSTGLVRTQLGGAPRVPALWKWPSCEHCHLPQQFLADLDAAELGHSTAGGSRALVFMCRSGTPGCEPFAAFSGSNHVEVLRGSLGTPKPPPLPPIEPIRLCAQDLALSPDLNTRETQYARVKAERPSGAVLGLAATDPVWIQEDETPACQRCRGRMVLLAQLEEGWGPTFCDAGCAYVFLCGRCDAGAMLVQCA